MWGNYNKSVSSSLEINCQALWWSPLPGLGCPAPEFITMYLQCSTLFLGLPGSLHIFQGLHSKSKWLSIYLFNSCCVQAEKGPHWKPQARAKNILSGKWLGRVQRSGTPLRGKIINVNLTKLRVEEWKLWFLEEMG